MADDRHGTDDVDDETLDAVAEALRTAETGVALTGAGVSTASGIPSFRGDDGIWERHDPADFHRRRLDADPAGFWADRISLRESIYGDLDPEPNAAHEALAGLESAGHLDAVLTQKDEAQRLARDSDVFLAVGSSLSVQPASLLPKIAAEAGSTLVVINYEETPRDASAAHVLRADVTHVLPAIVERV
ncbi:SIR2 family NAD-dependent protein deacylase [Haloarcula sp. CGMCC 1.2071]|uniref:SIR2 family NAD-dependent protein deacylase n=1 Tax=Haloarcula sp. CGMCC 1.2071 TaxID=3111454 RepID=UPI00300E9A03